MNWKPLPLICRRCGRSNTTQEDLVGQSCGDRLPSGKVCAGTLGTQKPEVVHLSSPRGQEIARSVLGSKPEGSDGR